MCLLKSNSSLLQKESKIQPMPVVQFLLASPIGVKLTCSHANAREIEKIHVYTPDFEACE